MSFAALAAVLSLAYSAVVARRWARSRRSAFAAWAVGLLIFAVAAAAQAIGEARGFDQLTFRVFYLLGGVLGVAVLALGTVHLLAPPRIARVATLTLAAVAVAIAVDAALEPVDPAGLRVSAGILGDAFSHQASPVRVAAIALNIIGTVVLVGGSAWSVVRLVRDRAGLDRVVCNVLLTAGALVIAAGFSAAKLAGGSLDTLGAYEAAGMAMMFAGFLSLGRARRAPAAVPSDGAGGASAPTATRYPEVVAARRGPRDVDKGGPR